MAGKGAWVAGADRREAPGPKPEHLGRRLRLRRQPPRSWQLSRTRFIGAGALFCARWGARGAECLPRDVPRRSSQATSRFDGITAHRRLCVRTGSGIMEARPHPGALKSRPCTGCAFLPTLLRRFPSVAKAGHHFPPPCEGGGRGGDPCTTSHGCFQRSLPLSSFSLLSQGERNRSRPTSLLHHPPYPPFARGGKRIARDVVSARAQQKHASRNRPSSSVNTHFS